MSRSVLAVAVLTGTLLAVPGIAGSASGATDKVRIGLEAPLTGDQQNIGAGMLDGAKLAAKRLNAKGGIDGKQVEIVPIDDAADPATGVTAASAAIASGLDGVVGPYNSGVGAQTLPLYLAAGLVPIRLTSADSTAGLGFTLQPMTSQIAPVASKALTDWLAAKKVAIAYDPTTLYTETVAAALQQSLQAAGVAITAFQPIEPGKKSYTDVVTTLAATDPDVIYAATYYPEGGLIAKAMHQLKTDAQCVADYGSYDAAFVTTAGVAAARACPVVGVPAPGDFKGSKRFLAAYRAQFGEAPGTWSPYTYDSLNVLAAAVEQAGGFDAAALTAALNQVDGFKGWTGSVTLEAPTGNRQPATVVVAKTNANGQLHVDRSWAAAVGEPF